MPSLLLGGIVFQGFEIPERIEGLGGKHAFSIKKLLGGQRVIDAMGPDDRDPEWSGIFQGGDAVGRARRLDRMREAGSPVLLAWGGIARTVLIRLFEFDPERTYQVPYRISVIVASKAQGGAAASLDSLVTGDLALVRQLVG